MKSMKTIAKQILALSAGAFLLVFVGCSDVAEKTASQNEAAQTCTVSGSLSVGNALPSKIASSLSANAAARSATSSFATESEYRVYEYHLKETTNDDGSTTYERESGEPLTGSVDKTALLYSVALNQTERWEIEITLWSALDSDANSSVAILNGSTTVTVSERNFLNQTVRGGTVTLTPQSNADVSGAILLQIKNEAESISSVAYSWIKDSADNSFPASLTDGTLDFTDGEATFTFSSVKSGVYEVLFAFKNSAGETLYSCTELIPVFSGFTTDTWYGESPYLHGLEDDDGGVVTQFVITSDLLTSYAKVDSLGSAEYPLVLWDKGAKEDETWSAGYNVFSADATLTGVKIGDGSVLAEGKTISDFAIDPVTQAIYTLENTSGSETSKVVKYPTYAGYAKGKTVASGYTASTLSGNLSYICSYNDTMYAYSYSSDALFKAQDGTFTKLSVVDETSAEFSLSSIPYPRIAADETYLYMAYRGDGSESGTYSVYLRKFSISGTTLTQVASCEKTLTDLGVYGVTDGQYQLNGAGDLSVSDIIVDSARSAVYVLVNENVFNSMSDEHESRGGIIKFTNTASAAGSVTTHTLTCVALDGSSTNLIYGWAYDGYHPTEGNDTNYFYGAKRFIAKKPDELVIADDGGYEENNEKKNKNRVVKMNLETFAMDTVDVNVGFDVYVSNCGFSSNYTGSGY